ncbi:MAG: hypothetical protein HQ564_09155 [Candidatus Saganbacteria bacterium]|nr:hypothetical protein [Candidatus Saganbacteria bacterium]
MLETKIIAMDNIGLPPIDKLDEILSAVDSLKSSENILAAYLREKGFPMAKGLIKFHNKKGTLRDEVKSFFEVAIPQMVRNFRAQGVGSLLSQIEAQRNGKSYMELACSEDGIEVIGAFQRLARRALGKKDINAESLAQNWLLKKDALQQILEENRFAPPQDLDSMMQNSFVGATVNGSIVYKTGDSIAYQRMIKCERDLDWKSFAEIKYNFRLYIDRSKTSDLIFVLTKESASQADLVEICQKIEKAFTDIDRATQI